MSEEFEIQRNFELGQGAGWEDAGNKLMAMATAYFEKGNDSTATLLRDLANEFITKGKQMLDKAREAREAKP